MNNTLALTPAASPTLPNLPQNVKALPSAGTDITLVRSLHELARAAAPLPFLSFPAELRALIRTLLDVPTQIALAQTCTTERNIYSTEQRKWLIFEKHCLALVGQAKDISQMVYKTAGKANTLEQYYRIILSRLFNDEISDKMCKETAALAEKFFNYLDRQSIKKQLNQILMTKTTACNWQAIFEKLARVNLHLCVTLITTASPEFDPACERQGDWTKIIHYPFTEYYPFLVDKLQFGSLPVPKAPAGLLTQSNITLDHARAQYFFCKIRTTFHFHNTALHFAATEGYIDILPALVQDHHCIDLADTFGNTALIQCVQNFLPRSLLTVTSVSIVQTLLSLQANPNLQNIQGDTALICATSIENIDIAIVIALLEGGANMNLQNKKGDTALACAVKNNRIDIVQTLLEQGADINLQDKTGLTALMHAVIDQRPKIVELLLAHHADRTLENKMRKTALLFAQEKQNQHIVNLLENS
jgi:hypothetical protein